MASFDRAGNGNTFSQWRKITLFASVCGIALSSSAYAQSQPQPGDKAAEEASSANPDDIIVTGSLVSRSGFQAPTPLTVLTADDLTRSARPNIADTINLLPSVRPSLTPTSTTNSAGLAGQSFLDLRGLGYQRTLVLVDGRRYVPTVASGGVSISSIPQALIKTVDIVTGGASSTYGSDAVAGVVNLRVDDKFEGLRGTVQGGITDHDDDRNFLVSLGYGHKFADGRGNIVLGAEASQNSGIGRVGDRSWGAKNYQLVANPAYTATNSEPQFLLTDNILYSNVSYGGVINSPGALKGIQFANNGSPIPFNYGTLVTSSTMKGGDGAQTTADGILAVPVDRYSGFGRLTYEFSSAFTGYAEFAYADTKSSFPGLASVDQITIQADNAYLPASIRSVMVANNIPSFVMGKTILDNSRIANRSNVQTYQGTVGGRGSINANWSWDAYYSYGRTDNDLEFSNARITSRFNQAVDAVVNPANGSITCRSTLTNPGNGCVPMNLFGYGNESAQSLAWVDGSGFNRTVIDQHEVAATLRGSPFATWAGPVNFAVGGEYRHQHAAVTSDALSATGAFRGNTLVPYAGSVSVKEAFGEALLPLAKDQSWAKSLSLDLAGRVTDYSTSGTVETWKAGVDYALNDSIRFRATRSRDIRAPSLSELFAAGSVSTLGVTDPATGQTYLTQTASTGNRNLKPEKADTLTAGIVLSPTFLPRFYFSADYYDIKLNDAIVALTPQAIVTQCYTIAPQACSLITRGSNGLISSVANAPVNLQQVLERGIDFEAAYRIPFGGSELQLRGLVTYVIKANMNMGGAITKLDGSVDQPAIASLGGTPHWRFNANADYKTKLFTFSLTGRYIGGGQINTAYTAKNINIQSVSGRMYFDTALEVPLFKAQSGRDIALFGTIQNMFDNDPPITGVGGYGTTRSLYDVIGRVYTAGVRFRL